jgi:hypothetical protein
LWILNFLYGSAQAVFSNFVMDKSFVFVLKIKFLCIFLILNEEKQQIHHLE